MTLKKKLLFIFFSFNLVLIFFGFNFFQILLKSENMNKMCMQQKEALTNIYQRRDFIKNLLLINDYEIFIQKEKLLKSKKTNSSLEKTNIMQDIRKIKSVENKILSLHRENLKLNLDFSDIYKKEKSTRYMIRDIVYKGKNYNETKALGDVKYKSKEAIFQYKDKKHFDDWQLAIYNLKKTVTTSDLLNHIEKYHKISHDISDIFLSQNIIMTEIAKNMDIYSNLLNKVDKNVNLLEINMNKSLGKINKILYQKFITTMMIVVLFFIMLGIFIHILLIKPLEILKNSTEQLSRKNFDHKINIHRDDEIGQLADHFNIMVANLKSIYSNLENMVTIRTADLKNSNSELMKEIYENKKLEKMLKKQTITDDLTGLLNRRAAYAFLLDEMEKVKTQEDSLTVCYLDIDNFKKINDSFGHEEGDRYLKEFSEILKLNLRQGDHIFRMGGDEFVAAFPNKHKKDVKMIFEKRVLPELKSKLDIEFSYGIFEFSNLKNLSLDEIIKKTDKKMYKNKQKKKKNTRIPLKPSFI